MSSQQLALGILCSNVHVGMIKRTALSTVPVVDLLIIGDVHYYCY